MAKIYVIGDFGTDGYHIGRVRGMSAEAPIPVLTGMRQHWLPGMAGNVTANLEALGADVTALSPEGDRPIKNRLYTEDGVQLARWDVDDACEPYTVEDLIPLITADAVVVADYGKGSITPTVTDILRDVRIPIFVDTKQSPAPWIGSEATLFPNLSEWRQFEEQYRWIERVVLKQGSLGLSYVTFGQTVLSRPSEARFAQCVNGAGDTVLAAFVVAALAGGSLPDCLDFANLAAAEVVEAPFLQRTTTVGAIISRYEQRKHESTGKFEDGTNWAAADPTTGSEPPSTAACAGAGSIPDATGDSSPTVVYGARAWSPAVVDQLAFDWDEDVG